MATIKELIGLLGNNDKGGSSVLSGVPYQNIPGLDIPFHRGNSDRRAERVMEIVDMYGKTVFDFGCSVGTMSGVFGKKAKSVVGFDYDGRAIDVAKMLYNSNISFENRNLTVDFLDTFPQVDVAVWTSQFMWMVKQHGMGYALDFLWNLSTKADVLVFESAGRGDGSAPLDIRQEDFFRLLCRNTVYQDITDHGPWNDGWTPRNVFVCKRPFRGYESHWSKVEALRRGIVRKSFKDCDFSRELMGRELSFLKRLDGSKFFPKLLGYESNSISMSYEGIWAKWLPENDLVGILSYLRMEGIIHRDIRPGNLLWNGDNVVLIDFSFAMSGDEITNYHYDLGGRYKCPYGFDDEYSLRKIQKELING